MVSMRADAGLPGGRGRRRWGLTVCVFPIYVGLVVVLALEGICRLGWVDNPGYRRQRLRAEADGGVRVLLLGDSFSADLRGSASRLLKQALRERDVGLLNVAGSGFGVRDYLEVLRRDAGSYRPHLVLLNYYVGNDTVDFNLDRVPSRAHRLVEGALRSFHLGELLLQIRARWVLQRQLRPVQREAVQAGPRLTNVLNLFLVEVARKHPEYLTANLLMEHPGAVRSWETNRLLLAEIRRESERVGARLVVAASPSTLQVNDQHVAFYTNLGLHYDARIAGSRVPQDRLAAFCREQGIPFLDLLPAFRARAAESFYLTNDDHWNAAGNQLAFETLLRGLEGGGWITPAHTPAPASGP